MEVSQVLLAHVFKSLIVYSISETLYKWCFDKNDEFVKIGETKITYFLDYGEDECEISQSEYLEFLRLEKVLFPDGK